MTLYAHEGVDWGNVRMLEHLVAIAAVENNEVIAWAITNERTIYGVCDRNAEIGETFNLAIECAVYFDKEAVAFIAGDSFQKHASNDTVTTLAAGQHMGFVLKPAAADDDAVKVALGSDSPNRKGDIGDVVSATNIIDATDAGSVITQCNALLAVMRTLEIIGPDAS